MKILVTQTQDVPNSMYWIKCSEKMPEDLPENSGKNKIKVLVVLKGKNGRTIRTQTRFIRAGQWCWSFSASEVTHWMPLPELPEEEIKKWNTKPAPPMGRCITCGNRGKCEIEGIGGSVYNWCCSDYTPEEE